jgi:hypothetical protein
MRRWSLAWLVVAACGDDDNEEPPEGRGIEQALLGA